MTEPDPGRDPYLSPQLDDEQLALLCRYGQARPTTSGQVLFREGDRAYEFLVVLSGAVAVVDHEAGVERELVRFGPGRFVPELNILTGERVFATAVVREPGSVLEVPVDRLQQVIAQDQELSDLIVQAMLRRRQWVVERRAGLQIFGSRSSPDARRLRQFAARNRLPHVWVGLDTDPAAGAVLARQGLDPGDAPLVLMRGAEVLRNPSNAQLARAAGWARGQCRKRPLTWPWSAPARPAWPLRCTGRRRGWLPRSSTGWEWAGRSAQPPGSRTTWASRWVLRRGVRRTVPGSGAAVRGDLVGTEVAVGLTGQG